MGVWINFSNHVTVANRSFDNGHFKVIGYHDITSEIIEEIVQNKQIEWIQIREKLPEQGYRIIDRILERRQDLYFHINSINQVDVLDLSVLEHMPHMSKISINAYLRDNQEAINTDYLCKLENLKGLQLATSI